MPKVGIQLSKSGPYPLHLTRCSRTPHLTRVSSISFISYSVFLVILIGVCSSCRYVRLAFLHLVDGKRRPTQKLRIPKHLESPVLFESLDEQHLLLADSHGLTHGVGGRSRFVPCLSFRHLACAQINLVAHPRLGHPSARVHILVASGEFFEHVLVAVGVVPCEAVVNLDFSVSFLRSTMAHHDGILAHSYLDIPGV